MRAALAVLGCLALLAFPARAQDRLRLEARLGLGGTTHALPPGWTPLFISLENAGPGRTVEVEVEVDETSTTWRSRRRVTLSAGQRWRGVTYVPSRASGRSVDVSVREDPAAVEPGRAPLLLAHLGRIGFRVRGGDYYYGNVGDWHVLVAGREVEQRDARWLAVSARGAWNAPTAQLASARVEDLPDRPEGFACIDTLILLDADLTGLSAAQQDALVAWVELGGEVVLVPRRRPDFPHHPLVRRLLDGRAVRAHETDTLPWVEHTFGELKPSRERFVVYSVAPRAGEAAPWAPVARDASGPFGVDVLPDGGRLRFLAPVACGSGLTWLVAYDPTELPFSTANLGFDNLALRLSAELQGDYGRLRRAAYGQHPSVDPRAVRLIGVRSLPSQGVVIALVLSFIVVVAPVNFLVLRRRDRQMLLVATVPAISLLWTGLILVTGYVTKGMAVEARRATLIDVDLGRRAARETTHLAFMAGAAGDYTVAFAPGLLPTRLVREPGDLSTLAHDQREEPDGGIALPALRLGLWGPAAFRAERERLLPGALRIARGEGGRGVVLENGTDLALEAAVHLDATGKAWRAGPVAAGASARLEEAPPPPSDAPLDLAALLVEEARREPVRAALQLGAVAPVSGQVVALVQDPPPAATIDGRRPDTEVVLLRARERSR